MDRSGIQQLYKHIMSNEPSILLDYGINENSLMQSTGKFDALLHNLLSSHELCFWRHKFLCMSAG